MNEKDAIIVIRELLQDNEKYRLTNIERNALEILLMIYYKEKAKAEMLENELKPILELDIPIDTLINEFERLENLEDDREQFKIEVEEARKANLDFKDCWLHKDKIKEKIKEVENGKENYIFERLTSEDIRRTIITNLQELLEK